MSTQPQDPGRQAWLARRRHGIGSSDIAVVLGLHDTRTPYDIYCEKRELVPDIEANERMEWGKELEQVIARKWARKREVEITWLDRTLDGPEPWIFATPDFAITEPKATLDEVLKAKEGGEVKNISSAEKWGGEDTDDIPAIYAAQAQWVMLVTGWVRCWLPVLFGGNRLRTFLVLADPGLQRAMADYGRQFWQEHVAKGEAPPIDYSESANEYLKQRFPSAMEPARAATEAEVAIAIEFAKVKAQKMAAERRYVALGNQLRESIGPAKGILHPTFKITWYDVKGSEYTVHRKPGRMLRPGGELFKVLRDEEEE